jgi:hypothetical protein
VLQTVAGTGPELVKAPPGLGDADHRHVEVAAPDHRLECGEDLLGGEVAGRAEEDQGIRVLAIHHEARSRAGTISWWPPNSRRMADISLSAKSASPRELNRS